MDVEDAYCPGSCCRAAVIKELLEDIIGGYIGCKMIGSQKNEETMDLRIIGFHSKEEHDIATKVWGLKTAEEVSQPSKPIQKFTGLQALSVPQPSEEVGAQSKRTLEMRVMLTVAISIVSRWDEAGLPCHL